MVDDLRGQEVEHDVRVFDSRPAAGKPTRLQVAGGRGTRLVEEPLDPNPDHPQALLLLEQGHRLLALLHNVELKVVLEVLAHPGDVLHQGDPHLLQVGGVTDARQHQKLGRVDGAAANDDL